MSGMHKRTKTAHDAAANRQQQSEALHQQIEQQQPSSLREMKPILSFGLLADLHYMDADNASNFAKTKIRRFRNSLTMLQEAANFFESWETDCNILLGDIIDGTAKKISPGLHLRGLETISSLTKSTRAPWFCTMGNHEFYNFTRAELKHHTGYFYVPAPHSTDPRVCHHHHHHHHRQCDSDRNSNTETSDQSNSCDQLQLQEQQQGIMLQRTLGVNKLDPTDSLYYSFSPAVSTVVTTAPVPPVDVDSVNANAFMSVTSSSTEPLVTYTSLPSLKFRVIVLDGYDISSIGPATPAHGAAAEALLREKNKAYANGDNNWFASLPEENLRYVPYNGGIGKVQLAWLTAQLQEVVMLGERCFIVCHMPLDPRSSSAQNPLWNYEEVLQIVLEHGQMTGAGADTSVDSSNRDTPSTYPPLPSAVIAVISGHAHNGGYYRDPVSGIHHITPPAPVECEDGEVSYGIFRVMQEQEQKQKQKQEQGLEQSVSLTPLSSRDVSTATAADSEVRSNSRTGGGGVGSSISSSSNSKGGYVEVHWTGKTPIKSVHPWPERMHFY